jgi:hypothetical protein
MNQGASSDMPLFRGKAASSCRHKQDKKQFEEISYDQIGLSIADITVV